MAFDSNKPTRGCYVWLGFFATVFPCMDGDGGDSDEDWLQELLQYNREALMSIAIN